MSDTATTIDRVIRPRLGEEFDVDYESLLGTHGVMERAKLFAASPASGSVSLPLFPRPISGHTMAGFEWDGSSIELTRAAAAKLPLAVLPYVLVSASTILAVGSIGEISAHVAGGQGRRGS